MSGRLVAITILTRPRSVEAVELIEELHQSTLDLTIGGCALREATAADSVHFVHEDHCEAAVRVGSTEELG